MLNYLFRVFKRFIKQYPRGCAITAIMIILVATMKDTSLMTWLTLGVVLMSWSLELQIRKLKTRKFYHPNNPPHNTN